MKFATWLENRLLLEGGRKRKPQPLQPRKEKSNIVKPTRDVKPRNPPGIKDTSFRPRERPRAAEIKKELEQQ